MEWPKFGLSQKDIANSPFSGNGYIVARKDGKGLRMVSTEQYFASYGIPSLKNLIKAQLWFAEMAKGTKAKAKWADGSEVTA